jgi:hypothetical protein
MKTSRMLSWLIKIATTANQAASVLNTQRLPGHILPHTTKDASRMLLGCSQGAT